MGRRWALLGAAVPLGLALALCTLPAAAAGPPPIPAQPGVPPTACASPPPSGTWSRDAVENDPGGAPSYEVAVDPWTPCRLYRAVDAQTVQRSTDGGASWITVFHDTTSNLPAGAGNPNDPGCSQPGDCPLGGPFEASGLYVPARDRVVLAERTNGDAVVVSRDGGTTWTLATGFSGTDGQALTPVGSSVLQIAFAPSNPDVGYAVVGVKLQGDQEASCSPPAQGAPGNANFTIYTTHDGGLSWAPVSGSGSSSTDVSAEPLLRVDPTTPARGLEIQAGFVRETTDGFKSSTGAPAPAGGQGPQGQAVDAAMVPTAAHPNRWLVATASGLFTTDDKLTTSRQVIPEALVDIRIAADPASPNRVLVAAMDASSCTARAFFSDDAFDHERSLPPPPDGTVPQAHSPLRMDGWMAADGILQALPGGTFYLTGCSDSCHTQAVWHIAPLAPAANLPPPPATGKLADLGSCPQPGGLVPLQTDNNAAIAFDGHDILYTRTDESGAAPLQGLIRRLSPDCRVAGTITVTFNASDLTAVGLSGSLSAHPLIDDLSYDPRRNEIWLMLAASTPTSTNDSGTVEAPGVFIAHVDAVAPTADTATARLAFTTPGCASFFSYGHPGDFLWTCPNAGNANNLGRIHASTGVPEPSCFAGGFGFRPAAWLFVEPNAMYVQDENDSTLHLFDATNCRDLGSFAHDTYGERGEDEQLACDSITFAAAGQGAAMWNRDVLGGGRFAAYRLPVGTCHFPTALSGPTVTVVQGEAAAYCAQLTQQWPGGTSPIQGRSVTFSGAVSGTLLPRGAGSECASISSAALPVGDHPLALQFGGDDQFLPAVATGLLRVVPRPAASPAPTPAPTPPPPPPGSPVHLLAAAPIRPAAGDAPVPANPPPAAPAGAAAEAPAPAAGGSAAGVAVPEEEAGVAAQGLGRGEDELSFSGQPPDRRALRFGGAAIVALVAACVLRRGRAEVTIRRR
jgi:hypothetical protein